ncbi:MAG: ankyrin repeat domain-containing protein, partial [Pirellulaceae bacterium]|nr:ankyrin repeat domain-containing protein [Pirellulaceae bacterium]
KANLGFCNHSVQCFPCISRLKSIADHENHPQILPEDAETLGCRNAAINRVRAAIGDFPSAFVLYSGREHNAAAVFGSDSRGTGDSETVKKMLSQHPELLHVGYLEPWLHEAAKKGQIEIATWLLDSGVDINATGGTFRGNALHWATYYKQPEFVKFLLENGAKFDTRSIYSNPIITAIEDGNLDLVRLFLKFGFDPNVIYTIEDGDLRNALSYAEDLKHTAIVAELRNAGCSLPEKGRFEFTNEGHHQILLESVSKFVGAESAELISSFTVGKKMPKVNIFLLNPTDSFPFYSLFTIGFSDEELPRAKRENEYRYGEFIAHLPISWQFDSMSLKDKRLTHFEKESTITKRVASGELIFSANARRQPS